MFDFSIDSFTNVINTSVQEPYSSLLNGVTFGRDIPSHLGLYEKFKKSGLLHIMVLSGSNIALLGAMLESFFSFVHKKIAVMLTICFIVIFTIIVGFEPPIVRASIMGVISLLAVILDRRSTALYSLLLTSVIMIIIQSSWMTNVSFLLSFSATLGIILFGQRKKTDPWWFPHELRISLSAQLFTTPIIFIYFKQISLIAPISNLLISFIIAPLMFFGFCIAILGLIHPFLTTPFTFLATGLLKYLLFIVDVSSAIPYSFLTF